MKLKTIILVSILLAVLTFTAVSASEDANMTVSNNIAVEDNSIIADNPSDEVIGDEEGNSVTEFDIVFPESVKAMQRAEYKIYAPNNTNGEITIYMDGEVDDSDSITEGGIITRDFRFDSLGKHTIKVKFVSNNDVCKNATFSKTYDIKDYTARISLDLDENVVYGKSTSLAVILPMDATGIMVLSVNGKKIDEYSLGDDVDMGIQVPAEMTRTSQLNVSVVYKGDKKYKAKTFNRSFDVVPFIKVPSYVGYDENITVKIDYYDGALVNLKVLNSDDQLIFDKNVTCVGENFRYDVAADFNLGDQYCLFATPSDGESGFDFVVTPKLSFGEYIWINDTNLTFEFPSDFKGKTFRVVYEEGVIFEGPLDNSSRASVQLTQLTPGMHSFYFRLVDEPMFWYYPIIGMEESPLTNISFSIPDKVVLKNTITVDFGDSTGLGGNLLVYLDGNLVSAGSYTEQIQVSTDGLALANHTLLVVYEGDDYFSPSQCTRTFEVVEHLVAVPKTVIVNEDDYAYVILPRDAQGTLKFYIDGKQKGDIVYFADDCNDGEYGTYVSFYLGGCDMSKEHTFKVIYSGDSQYAKFTESYKFGMNFTFRFSFNDPYVYGEKNQVMINLPSGLKSNYEILIDGKQFNKYHVNDDGEVCVDISEFAGTHDIAIDFKGDKTYLPLRQNATFTVNPLISYKDQYLYGDAGSVVSLMLPKDANGTLVVEIDGGSQGKAQLTDGYAQISLANMSMGSYNLKANYTGTDYGVVSIDTGIVIIGGIVAVTNDFIYGDTLYVSITLPEGSAGTLKVNVGDKYNQADLVNGSVVIPITGLKVGYPHLNAEYYENGELTYILEDDFIVAPRLSISNMTVFAKNEVTLTADSGASGQMAVSVDGNSQWADIKNGKATLSLSKLTAGMHTISVSFSNSEIDYDYGKFTVNVKKASKPKITLTPASIYYMDGSFKAKVLGVDGKVAKGASVIFKVNGKKVKTVKTNNKGIAAFKMTNLPKAYKLTAQYSKVSVTKKVTVKRVLALKNTVVKKSAKSAILQATLKKGKTPIKNKLVTFKFAGKTFKAKTNNAGLAKVVVNKAFFNRLPVGKKIIFQATYVKDTVRKTAIVKK